MLDDARRTRAECVDVLHYTGPATVRSRIVVSGESAYRLKRMSGAKLSKLMAIAFPDGFDSYAQDTQEEIAVDGIPGLRIKGTAKKRVAVTITEMVDTRPVIGRWVSTSFTGAPGPGRTSSTNIYGGGEPQLVG